MTDETRRQAISVLAGESVLGTLTPEERAELEQRLAGDPEFAAEVAAWERRLAPLARAVPEVQPSAALWARVAARTVDAAPAPTEVWSARRPAPARSATGAAAATGTVIDLEAAVAARTRALQARIGRWRWATAAATAAAACLALFAVLGRAPVEAPGQRYLGVVSASGETPPLVVAIDLATGQLAVRALEARPQAGKAFELWAVPSGAQPVSLGVVDKPDTRSIADKVPARVWQDPGTVLAVSVEPPGGSPTRAPTGPVIYTGKLIKAQ